MIDDLFDIGVVHTYPSGIHFITVCIPDFPSMQFNAETGEYTGLTEWEYIQTVDVQEQIREAEEEAYWELVASVLEYYHALEYRATADYDLIARKRSVNTEATSEYEETIYEYNCPAQTIYLTEEHYPVSWENQYVDTEKKWYMYNFSDTNVTDILDTDELDLFKYKIAYEWKREKVSDA